MKDQIISLIRTFVPIAVGSFIGWLTLRTGIAVPDEASNGLTLFFVAMVTGLYYAIARALEAKWPAFGILLGTPRAPIYLGSQKAIRAMQHPLSEYNREMSQAYVSGIHREKLSKIRQLIDANEHHTVVNTSEVRAILNEPSEFVRNMTREPGLPGCGCKSHDPADHQGNCGHCGAAEDEYCREGCPVDANAFPGPADKESDVVRHRPITSHKKLTREERQAQQDTEQQAREDRD